VTEGPAETLLRTVRRSARLGMAAGKVRDDIALLRLVRLPAALAQSSSAADAMRDAA
jgi:hypothetical protein